MPNETVVVTVNGANGPKTINVTVPVNPSTGTGSATVTYTGAAGGSDTLSATATVTGHNYSSNTAQVNWQVTNNTIQMAGTVDCYAWHDSPHSGPVSVYIWSSGQRPLNTATAHATGNSISFDTYRGSVGSGEGNPFWYTLNSSGSQVGYQVFPPYNADFNCIVIGNILVPKAATYTMTLTYKDSSMWGIGTSTTGAVPTWPGKGTLTGPYGQTQTVNGGYPLLNAPGLTSGSGGVIGTASTSVTFPSAGLYPIEVNWDYWYHSGRILHATVNYGEIAPVTYIGPPPTGATPSGNLTITPTGGNTNLAFVGSPISLTVTLSGITYTNVSYIPAYESVTGNLPLYNSPSSNTFTYPTYNSQSVDKAAAITNNAWGLNGDNSSWQGRMSVKYDGTNFVLNYNGAAPDSHVDVTTLTISAEDIAWYNSVAKTFDLFQVSSNVGGVSTQVLVNWYVKPTISSVSPTTVSADGASHVFNVSLAKPISPRQLGSQYSTGNTFSASFTMVGGTVTNTQAVYDAGGWLTGWNVTATIPLSTSNGTATLNANVGGTLTYLNGSGFTTGAVSYINGAIATINLTGSAFTAPEAYSFTASAGPSWPYTLSSISLTGVTFQQQNNPITLQFIGVNQSTSAQFNIVAGTQSNRTTGTFNGHSGWLTTFTGSTAPSSIPPSPGAIIGFKATDSTSNLSVTYLTSTAYYYVPPSGGGGGGGGGCFTAAVGVETPTGLTEFGDLPKDRPFEIVNQTGTHLAELIIHENYKGWMVKLAPGKLVTLDHLMKLRLDDRLWVSADQKYVDYEHVWFEGTVYNMHVLTDQLDDQHYILFNGDVAHNLKALNVDLVL